MPKVHSTDVNADEDSAGTPTKVTTVPQPINVDFGRADFNALVDKLNEVIHYLKFKE